MNNKFLITVSILIISVFWFSPVSAQNGLVVQFENTPLFNMNNLLAGDTVTGWIRATNNSGQAQDIGLDVIGFSTCNETYCLSDLINLEISQDNILLYQGTLMSFYGAGEIPLTSVNNSQTTQYDLVAALSPQAPNNYQNLTTSFDFEIGLLGGQGGSSGGGGGGGGGGGSYINLTITNEQIASNSNYTVTLAWQTNLAATSQVIYSKENQGHNFSYSSPPLYGYANLYPDSEDSTLVTSHSVAIPNLESCTKYYYRVISHTLGGAPTIGAEYSFTTICTLAEQGQAPSGQPNFTGPNIITSPKNPTAGSESIISRLPSVVRSSKGITGPTETAAPAGTTTEEGLNLLTPSNILGEGVGTKQKSLPVVNPPSNTFVSNLLGSLGYLFSGQARYSWWLLLVLAIYPLTKTIQTWRLNKKVAMIWLSWLVFHLSIAILFGLLSYRGVPFWIFFVLTLLNFITRLTIYRWLMVGNRA